MVDYRKLLKFYMDHVGSCEGTAFLTGKDSFSDLTPEENAALNEVYNEAHEEWLAQQEALRT